MNDLGLYPSGYDYHTRKAYIEGLSDDALENYTSLIIYATHRDDFTVAEAAKVIGTLPFDIAETTLAALYNDPDLTYDHKFKFVQVLGSIGSKLAPYFILELLEDPELFGDSDLTILAMEYGDSKVAKRFFDSYLEPNQTEQLRRFAMRDYAVATFASKPEVSGYSFDDIEGLFDEGIVNEYILAAIFNITYWSKLPGTFEFYKSIRTKLTRPNALAEANAAFGEILTIENTNEINELMDWLDQRVDELIKIGVIQWVELYALGHLEKRLRKLGMKERCSAFSLKFNMAFQSKELNYPPVEA